MAIPRVSIGRTGIEVCTLCFGTLTISPLQCNFSLEEGSDLLRFAIDQGISFFDTAQLYGTYPVLKEAVAYKRDIVISTKDYCHDAEGAERSLDHALRAIGRDYIDIFMLHEQESAHTIRGHWPAVEYLLKRKKQGDIRALGLSTHHVAAVLASLDYEELEIIHPIYNSQGIGICDGSASDMLQAINKASKQGKGILGMKPLGGGHLIPSALAELRSILEINSIHATAVGMKSRDEILFNAAIFMGQEPDAAIAARLSQQKRSIMIHDWCDGCGACVASCDHDAIRLADGQAAIIEDQCVLCAYCAGACPMFCIKVV